MGAYSMASPQWVMNRDRPRFFDQVGHQISIFSLNNDLVRLTTYEQPCQRSQNSEFQSHFSMSKIGRYLIMRPTYTHAIL